MSLSIGDRAPDFSLPDGQGKLIRLSDLKGKRVVLYFYPRDLTPGCTTEACGFRDAYADFEAQDVVVLGVSADDAKSHEKFRLKFRLKFQLLCDDGGQVGAAYDSYGLKKFMGKEFMGVFRNTFVISPKGTIEKIYKKVKSEGHAQQLLADLAELQE